MGLANIANESSGNQDAEIRLVIEKANAMGYFTQGEIRGTEFGRYWQFFPRDEVPNKTSSLKGPRTLKRIASDKHQRFYEEVNAAGVNITDLTAQADIKEKLILKYYPGRFGENGSQPISNYDPARVGSLFQNLFKYAKKVSIGNKKSK